MRHLMKIALATAALAFTAAAAPAYAANAPTPTPQNDPCSYAFVNSAVACVGYYGGNLITGTTGSSTTAAEQTYINLLLSGPATTSGPGLYAAVCGFRHELSLVRLPISTARHAEFRFAELDGLDGIGRSLRQQHRLDPNNVTAFWLINLGNTMTNTLTLTNGQGSSNAQIFADGRSSRSRAGDLGHDAPRLCRDGYGPAPQPPPHRRADAGCLNELALVA